MLGVVAAVAVFAGVARAEPAEVGDLGVYSSFYNKMNGFSGIRSVNGESYSVELKRERHLKVRAVDRDTEVNVVDVGSDGFGHNGDNAVCTHKFKDGSTFIMGIECREGWKYCIKSKLEFIQNGTNAVVEAEFDPSTCLKFVPFGERIVRMKVRPVETYAGIVYSNLVESSLDGKESNEVPYVVIKGVFDKVESDLSRIKTGREALGHNLVKNSEDFVVLAKKKLRERR